MKLDGKVAIITGAGGGIGEATALLFAREGARVCCNSLSASADQVARHIEEQGGQAVFFQGDVSTEEAAARVVSFTVEHYGRLDILFNNAGIVLPGRIDNTLTEDWDRTMAVNVRSTFLVSRYALPEIIRSHGCIINNASVAAIKGLKDRASYSASKGAVMALTRAMAADYLKDGIRINSVSPGTTESPSLERRIAAFADPTKARKDFVARQPMGRLGRPEEIAEAVLFLALSTFCTGLNLSIDGGMTL